MTPIDMNRVLVIKPTARVTADLNTIMELALDAGYDVVVKSAKTHEPPKRPVDQYGFPLDMTDAEKAAAFDQIKHTANGIKQSLAPVAAAAPIEPEKPKRTIVRLAHGNNLSKVIMGHAANTASFTKETATRWVTEASCKPASTSPCLSQLVKDGKLFRYNKRGEVRYRIINGTTEQVNGTQENN